MMNPSPSLVVITAADEVTAGSPDGCDALRDAVARLAAAGVPVVLASPADAGEVLALQRELGTTAPFICDGGASLYVPTGYFGPLPGFGRRTSAWDVITCAPPRRGVDESSGAVPLLVSLYRTCAPDVIIIGVASQWRDRVLLREADVPIVIRCRDGQERLRHRFPTAYVTERHGSAGWIEAMLGTAN